MDALLSQYLLHEISNISMDFVNQLIGQVKKQDICNYVTHFLCAHALTDNVWILAKVKEYYGMIETCKASEKPRLAKVCYALFHLIGQCTKATYVFHTDEDKPIMFTNDINAMLYNATSTEFPEIVQFKHVLSDEIYNLITILYDVFLYSVESKAATQNCFFIIRYLITLVPKQYLAAGCTSKGVNMDMMDFLFLTCMLFTNNPHCSPDVTTYITTCKDIFYYKARKKDKLKRVNLIFYCAHIIINKKVTNIPVDYEGMQFDLASEVVNKRESGVTHQSPEDSHDEPPTATKQHIQSDVDYDRRLREKLKYLYIYTEVDEQANFDLQIEKERRQMMAKLMRNATKEIEVDWILSKDTRDLVCVSKLQS